MIVSSDTPAWWAAALPTSHAFTAAGNLQWLIADRGKPTPGTLRGYLTSPRYTAPSFYDY